MYSAAASSVPPGISSCEPTVVKTLSSDVNSTPVDLTKALDLRLHSKTSDPLSMGHLENSATTLMSAESSRNTLSVFEGGSKVSLGAADDILRTLSITGSLVDPRKSVAVTWIS